MSSAKFIVLEGVDGVGTTTHTKLLVNRLQSEGRSSHGTREPSDGPIGVLIRQMLTGRVVVPTATGPKGPDWTTMALLFAADRADHVESEIAPLLERGLTVVSDRYDYSSVAYQATSAGGSEATAAWVRTLNQHARRPDLTLILEVPSAVSATRRADRANRELYEDDGLQHRIAQFYKGIAQYFPDDRIVFVNADRPMDLVAKEIFELVQGVCG